MYLNEIKTGEYALIEKVGGEGALRQHLLNMGVIPGNEITVIKYAPMGDPMEIRIHDYELTLRLADASKIEVKPIKALTPFKAPTNRSGKTPHLGLGEEQYKKQKTTPQLPEDAPLTFALIGNQNSGKTTLFNQLTGAKQRIGNFPGVTVDRKDGVIKGHKNAVVTDLPGIYSLSPYSGEERVSRNFVLDEKPTAIINIVDATNIERNFYLTMQVLELGIPVVVALNMMDELRGNGGSVDINRMEEMLGVPVVPISAAKNEGVQELIEHAVHIARYHEVPLRQDMCDSRVHGGAVHRCLHGAAHLIEDHADAAGIPVRFAASKIIEGDELILDKLKLDTNEKEMLEHIILQMEKERGLDRCAAIADMRFSFIENITRSCVTKAKESKEYTRSKKIDRILTGKYTAIPMFILIMGAIFFLTFNVIGAWLQELLEQGVEALTGMLEQLLLSWNVNEVVKGLVLNGICEGVGSVLSFMPIIITMFFFLSILEDSGYTARVAFFMDKLLRKAGLSGRSIVPLLIGFGCTVPAVMSTRTLPSDRDRKMTILLTPFMSCTAKLPIYAFFVDMFFPQYGGLIMTGLYFLGILVGILVALLFKSTLFKGEAVPFVMELPNYRLPRVRNVAQLLWEKAKDFLTRAFTVILIATVVVWFLQSFDWQFNPVENTQNSILAGVAGFFAPVFAPVGLGDWRICTALISGFMAKESVVSVLNVLYTGGAAMMSTLSAACMLVFSLLYTPCVAAIASIRRELGTKAAAAVVVWQCFVAWAVTLIVHLIGVMIGG